MYTHMLRKNQQNKNIYTIVQVLGNTTSLYSPIPSAACVEDPGGYPDGRGHQGGRGGRGHPGRPPDAHRLRPPYSWLLHRRRRQTQSARVLHCGR